MIGNLGVPEYPVAKLGFAVSIDRAVTDIRTEDYLNVDHK